MKLCVGSALFGARHCRAVPPYADLHDRRRTREQHAHSLPREQQQQLQQQQQQPAMAMALASSMDNSAMSTYRGFSGASLNTGDYRRSPAKGADA